jgi:hypothetical protein
MTIQHHWQVFSRPECSLCETMLAELAELLAGQLANLHVVDISEDPELERKYGTRIPVLLINGDFVCAYKLDRERVIAYLSY